MNLADLRRDYARAALDLEHTDPDPMAQFGAWFTEAESSQLLEPNAMTLATATAEGRPSARIVLLKGYDARGFAFFTDYRSRKGRELGENPQAALVFFWGELERQVRIIGSVVPLSPEESWAYYRTRPVGSRVGAWASHQSAVLTDRAVLEARVAELTTEYAGREIPLPSHWGGYRLAPTEIEFWQGRSSRLHDRIQYTHTPAPEQGWHRVRLSP